MNRSGTTPAEQVGHDESSATWIDLDGVVNMRDLGGLPTRDGRQIRPQRLIRSDNLQDLTEADLRRLLSMGVTDVLDLRTRREVDAVGPGPLREAGWVTHHHHSLLPDGEREATAADALAATTPRAPADPAVSTLARPADSETAGSDTAGSDTAQRDAIRAGQYGGYLTERPESVTAALRVIATSQGATVVHCAAGKDRTGVIVALALDLAGVPHEIIVDDYARSAQRIEAILRRLASSDFYAADPATYSVPDQTPTGGSMRLFLTALTERLGGAAGWLRRQGWTEADVLRLRATLLIQSGG